MADVLIVDDDGLSAGALAKLLRAEGHEAEFVQTAGHALRRLRQNPPDLVLLDLNMPQVGGLDLLEAFGSEAQLAHVPVALFTGQDDPAARNAARLLGAQDYILKGQGWERTHERIEQCLQQRPA